MAIGHFGPFGQLDHFETDFGPPWTFLVFLPFCHLDHARFWAFFGLLGLFAIVGLLGPLRNLGNIESSGPFDSLFGPFCTFWSFSATVVFFGQLFLAILALFVLCGHFKPFWPLDLFLATITSTVIKGLFG